MISCGRRIATFLSLSAFCCNLSIAAERDSATETEKNGILAALPKSELPLAIRFSQECPISKLGRVESLPVIATLAAPLITKLAERTVPATIGFLYDRGVNWLDEKKSNLSASSTALASETFYSKLSSERLQFGCVILVRGNFTRAEPKIEMSPGTVKNKNDWNFGTVKATHSTLFLAGAPEIYIEFAMEPLFSPIQSTRKGESIKPIMTHWKLKPVHIDYLATGAKAATSGKKHVIVDLRIAQPGKEGTQTLLAKQFDLGFLEIGKRYDITHVDGDFVPLPIRSNVGNQIFDLAPIAVTAVVTETEPGRDLAREVARALKDEDTKKQVVEDIATQVVTRLKEKLAVEKEAKTGK